MIWMLTAVPGAAGIRPPGHGHGAMAAMSGATLAVRCSLSAAGLRLVARPHPYRGWCRPLVQGYRSKTRRRLVMSAGMASMLIAML
jgi:hypothetical protein